MDNTNEIIISNKNTHTQIDKIEDNIVKIFYKNYNLCYNQTFEELFNIIFLDFHTYIKYTFINTIYSKWNFMTNFCYTIKIHIIRGSFNPFWYRKTHQPMR